MPKKLAVCALIVLLSGCDLLATLNGKTAQPTFKWATLNKHKLVASIGEGLAKASPNHELTSALHTTAEQAVNAIITAYAQQHGYQLIIGNDQPAIVYNQGRTVQDVTDDVLRFMSKNLINTIGSHTAKTK
jgi:hypothetical protein